MASVKVKYNNPPPSKMRGQQKKDLYDEMSGFKSYIDDIDYDYDKILEEKR
jgi:hypothetical protein